MWKTRVAENSRCSVLILQPLLIRRGAKPKKLLSHYLNWHFQIRERFCGKCFDQQFLCYIHHSFKLRVEEPVCNVTIECPTDVSPGDNHGISLAVLSGTSPAVHWMVMNPQNATLMGMLSLCFFVKFWWQQLAAAGLSLNCASCRGGWGGRSGALRRVTQWPWIEHPTFRLRAGHFTTELLRVGERGEL